MTTRLSLITLAVLACTSTASAQERWDLTLGLDFGHHEETTSFVPEQGEPARFYEGVYSSNVSLGVDLSLPWRFTGELRSTSELLLGAEFRRGSFVIGLRQGVYWEHAFAPRFALLLGPEAAFELDSGALARSHGNVALGLGMRAAHFELLWRPMIRFRLARESSAVFGGIVEHEAATQLDPLNFLVRFHFRSLGRQPAR